MKYLISLLFSLILSSCFSQVHDSTKFNKIEIYAIPFDSHFSKGVLVEDIIERSYIHIDLQRFEQFELEYGEEIIQMISESKKIPTVIRCTGIRILFIATQQNGTKHEVYFSKLGRMIYKGEHFETNSALLTLIRSYIPEQFK